ncbi:hypothetical protein IWX90DRAFT_415430 [Phyllosticta citrichinensis]|uniref:Uncharacterized protein n=1 Tax=Phyllosticta citrichinensis TaxID=1130410 RepID=A0ABR1XVH9_9PEZI
MERKKNAAAMLLLLLACLLALSASDYLPTACQAHQGLSLYQKKMKKGKRSSTFRRRRRRPSLLGCRRLQKESPKKKNMPLTPQLCPYNFLNDDTRANQRTALTDSPTFREFASLQLQLQLQVDERSK